MAEAGGAGGVRVGVAFNDAALEPSPTWTYLTATNSLVASYEINRGRRQEFDRTETGSAIIQISDRDGVLDPTNAAGPYYGLIDTHLQVKVELLNPVTDEWQIRFRGHIHEYNYDVYNGTYRDENGDAVGVTRLELECYDLFAILTAIEMQPDLVSGAPAFGDQPPLGAEGQIFFDNATVQDRIVQVLGNAGIPTSMYVVFTGNVYCAESTYAPSDNVLQVVQDAADAEFPTVSNCYCDRQGRFVFHGRLAKFDPEGTAASASAGAWDFNDWNVGDETAVLASITDTAQIRQFSYNEGVSFIRNYALCTPQGLEDSDVPDQISRDDTSIGQRGYCSWSAENLLIAAPTGNPVTNTGASTLTGNSAKDECALYALFITSNYAEPRTRINQIAFKAMHPSSAKAAANWDFVTRADIGDRINVTIGLPGGGLFNAEPFFIEGIRETVTPLNADYAAVTLELDTSPQAWFTAGAWSGGS